MHEFLIFVMKIALVAETIGVSAEIIAHILHKNDCCTDKAYDAAKEIHFVAFMFFEVIMMACVSYSMFCE